MEERKAWLVRRAEELFRALPGNAVTLPGGETLALYEPPLMGFAAAGDGYLAACRSPEVVGPQFWTPEEWLPGAGTVVSLFLPFTREVRESNRGRPEEPSAPWLYGRIEGQEFLGRFLEKLKGELEAAGAAVCIPARDSRFQVEREPAEGADGPDFRARSRWSERHAAYACGLGTFGLSRGLITRKGTAGRLGSLILDWALPPDGRAYTGVYDWCTRCGACAARCPAGAISLKHGKNNLRCGDYVRRTGERFAPRYGCGKCQTGVPCEHRAPGAEG